MKLRDYQEAAVESIFKYFLDGNKGNPLITAPTGVGKSLMIAGFLQRVYKHYPNQRIMMLTHVKELIEQNLDKLKRCWPNAPAGVYSAGMRKKESHFPITFAGIQSVQRSPHLFGHIDLIIIDEAHRVSNEENTGYIKFFNALKEINPNIKAIGLTATDYRMGYGYIWGKEDSFFDKRCINLTSMECFNWFIEQGYLVPVIPRKTKIELDVSKVHLQGGEYKAGELQAAVNIDTITIACIEQCLEECSELDSWLVFCSGVDHAIRVAELLNEMGVSAAALHTSCTPSERDDIISRFKAGELQAVTNNNILTTGFDYPGLKLIVILRPTMSPVMWVQMLGRGTRPDYSEGFDLTTLEGRLEAIRQSNKRYCMVMDFTANSRKLGPINDPAVPHKKGEGGGDAPQKCCPSCNTWNHAKQVNCIFCGAEFSFEVKLTKDVSTQSLIKDDLPVIETFSIEKITCSKKYGKNGKPNSLNVSYYCGYRYFNEYICIEHPPGSFPRQKALTWWKEHHGGVMPSTIDEALEVAHEIRTPTHVRVHTNLKYPEIKAFCYDGSNFGKEEEKASYIEVEVKENFDDFLNKQAELILNKNNAKFDDGVPF